MDLKMLVKIYKIVVSIESAILNILIWEAAEICSEWNQMMQN